MQGTALRSKESRRTTADGVSGEDELRLLGQRLAREFSAPVGIIPLRDRNRCEWVGGTDQDYPELDGFIASASETVASKVQRIALWHPITEPGRVWLAIFMMHSGVGEILAVTPFRAVDDRSSAIRPPREEIRPAGLQDVPCGPPCPDQAIQAWGEQVLMRLQGPGGSGRITSLSSPATCENIVIGRLIRRLRISDPPRKFQALATNVVRTALNVQAVAWVPFEAIESVIVSGGISGFEPSDYRTLTPHAMKESTFIMNTPRSDCERGKPDQIRRFAVVTGGSSGWLIAVNPEDERLFDGAEVEVIQYAASLIATQHDNAKIYAELKELLFGIIRALTAAIDAKDPYTCGHSERVARIAVRLAEEMGVSPQKRSDLYLAGLLHDIGKIGIDDEVLKKSGPLSPEEYRKIQSHVEIGVTILNDLRKLHHILPGVRHHHESHDGSGYPDKLSGDDIPLEARILAVADSFDAMSSNRPYRRRLTPMQIDGILKKGSGIQWDPRVINALFACRMDLEAIRQKGLGESLLGAVDVTLGRR